MRAWTSLVRCLVSVHDSRRDAATLVDLMAVDACPLADYGGVLAVATKRGRGPTTGTATHTTGSLGVTLEILTQLVGAVLGQVQFIALAVQGECDGLPGARL